MTKIVVIEDEEFLLQEIVDTLNFEGFEVAGAENGLQGYKLVRETMPDLVICDVMMPVLDGYGVLLKLRSEPETSLIPFIFLTAKASREDMRHGMDFGADDYVTKPFTREILLSEIRTRLEKYAASRREYDKGLDSLRNSIILTLPHELRTPLTSIILL